MNAKKCDKCGEFYVEVEANAIEQAIHAVVEALRLVNHRKGAYLFAKLQGKADLCSECEKSLRAWCAGGNNDE